MKETQRIFVTDCEGPVSRNDNAFELTCQFVPEGQKFFRQVSRYDDVLADVIKRRNYKAGDTLKLIVPFLKAHDATNAKMLEFSARNVSLIPGSEDSLGFLKGVMPSFIVSTSYEHYIRVLCRFLKFPYEKAYCTSLDIDAYYMSAEEQQKLKKLRREICALPLIKIPEAATSLNDFSERDRQTIERLDEIFWNEIMQMKSGEMLTKINPVGGSEKAKATREIIKRIGSGLDDIIYVGDSITDVESFKLIRESGGITVSFNGNDYAVREAEIAIISPNSLVVAVFADVFNRLGIEPVFDMVESWGYKSLEKHCVNLFLQEKINVIFPETLPKVSKVTLRNMKILSAESSAFRKLVRGANVGRLG